MNLEKFKGLEVHTDVVINGKTVANTVNHFTNLHQALAFHLINRKQGHKSAIKTSKDKYVCKDDERVYELKRSGEIHLPTAPIEDYEASLARCINELQENEAAIFSKEILNLFH